MPVLHLGFQAGHVDIYAVVQVAAERRQHLFVVGGQAYLEQLSLDVMQTGILRLGGRKIIFSEVFHLVFAVGDELAALDVGTPQFRDLGL